MRDTTKLALLALCGVLTAACTSRATGSSGFAQDNSNQASTPASNGADAAVQSLGGNPTGGHAGGVQCSAKSTSPGCACENVGASVACWTGPASERNKGKCHDGKQTCRLSDGADVGGGVWGSCDGEDTTCGKVTEEPDSGKPTKDAGPVTPPVLVCANPDVPNPDGGTAACCVNCGGCVPGAVAWCYDSCIGPPEYCVMTIQQTCQPDGTWGACTETGQTFTGGCVHFWDGCDLNGGSGSYAGNCDGVFQGCNGDFNNQCPGSTGTGDFGTTGPLPALGDGGVVRTGG